MHHRDCDALSLRLHPREHIEPDDVAPAHDGMGDDRNPVRCENSAKDGVSTNRRVERLRRLLSLESRPDSRGNDTEDRIL